MMIKNFRRRTHEIIFEADTFLGKIFDLILMVLSFMIFFWGFEFFGCVSICQCNQDLNFDVGFNFKGSKKFAFRLDYLILIAKLISAQKIFLRCEIQCKFSQSIFVKFKFVWILFSRKVWELYQATTQLY